MQFIRSAISRAGRSSLAVHTATLIAGDVAGSLLTLVAFGLVARHLGPEGAGILAVAQVYATFLDSVTNLQTWQPVIRAGAAADSRGAVRLSAVAAVGFLLDTAAAWTAAAVGLILLLIGQKLAVVPEVHAACVAFLAMLTLNITGTSIGLLRLGHRFRALGCRPVIVGTVKLGAGIWLSLNGGTVVTVAWGFAAAEIVGCTWLGLCALTELRRRNAGTAPSLAELRACWPFFRSFLLVGKIDSGARLVSRYVDTFLLTAVSTLDQVGIYRVAVQIAGIVGRLSDPLTQTIFPQLARLAAENDLDGLRRRSMAMLRRSSLGAVAALLVFFAVSGWGIRLVFGDSFVPAAVTTNVYVVAVAIAVALLPVVPTLQAMGLPRTCMAAQVVATGVYIFGLLWGASRFGAIGAAAAYVFYYIVWGALISVPYRRHMFSARLPVMVNALPEGAR
jgi:O-antigen/teichoic acid export membrane protein